MLNMQNLFGFYILFMYIYKKNVIIVSTWMYTSIELKHLEMIIYNFGRKFFKFLIGVRTIKWV